MTEKEPLLRPVQAMLFTNKKSLSTDLVIGSGFAATQLGKLVCELTKTRGKSATPEVSSSVWYILHSKVVLECSDLPKYFKYKFQSMISIFLSKTLL